MNVPSMRAGAFALAALVGTAAIAVAQVHGAGSQPVPARAAAGAAVPQAYTGSPLKAGQTLGYGGGQLLTFTYQQQFDCVDQPMDDRNYNGVPAASDPAEFAMLPPCQIGAPSGIDPTGINVGRTDKLYVIVPFFETNPKEPAFSPQLGATLKQLFGFVPDAFKIHPGVFTQCPEPGRPYSYNKGKPGTCTMHPLQIDLGPVLTALHKVPPKTVVNVPLVNHSHILAPNTINVAPEWWQVVVVLVEKPNAWPNASGSTGASTLAKLRAAQMRGDASPDVPSNFFLFFSSSPMAGMGGMRM